MRILHVIDYFQPKLGYQETFLPKEHAKLGHEVHVVTSERYNPIVYSGNATKLILGKRILGAGFFIEEGIKVWRLKTLFELPHAIWMRGLDSKIQELKPDIVIMHGIINFSAIRIAKLKKKLGNFKLICDDHMAFGASRSRLRILYPLFKWTFSHLIQEAADALVGVADTSKMFMHKTYGIPLERITVIPLGADDELFRFDEAIRQEIRKQLSVNEDDIVFIYAGKIVPVKGPHLLVEAALKLMNGYGKLKVILLGNGAESYIEGIKQAINAQYLKDRFIWHDAVPNKELHKFYSAANVAVWPREASLSMMEAMACNLPIIISDSSEITERVGHDNGLTYHEGDVSDLAGQMERLLDPELRRKMGQNGRKFVEEGLSWKIIARQFIEIVSSEKEAT
ncbi:glycosyltransferase family 4 protein [Chloroflexota bacterium]